MPKNYPMTFTLIKLKTKLKKSYKQSFYFSIVFKYSCWGLPPNFDSNIKQI